MKHQLSELIDLSALQGLMESFHRATGIKHALIDNDGRVLTAAGWEPVCTEFHRANPQSCERCQESDRYILNHLHEGPYVGYDCPNGLVDYATPVIIDGEHVANVFTGQMFHTPPDLEFFRRQAAEFGFDEPAYLAAVQRVPIVPRERMPDTMAFLAGLARMLAEQGLTRLRQLETKTELRRLNAELAERVEERTEEISARNRHLSRTIARHEETEAALRQEKQFSDDIINSLPGIFYMLDQRGCFVRWNRKLCEVSGYGDDEVAGVPATLFFDGEAVPLIQARIVEVFQRGESSVETDLVTKDGRRIPHLFTGRRTLIGGEPYLVGQGIDIAARKVLESELERQAHEDALTGVASRRHFLHLAERELARSRRYACPLSLLMLDIDQFKAINDRYGHSIGDRVLQQLAAACRRTLRVADIVGRLGGDEFAVILPETDRDQAHDVAQRLCEEIAAMDVTPRNGKALRCTASIGVTSADRPEDGIDELLRQADEALYRAKTAGRDRVSAFTTAP